MQVVLCHGRFDVLHAGHLHYLKEARELGDKLIVSLTADDYLENAPYFTEKKRKATLELIPWIDEVYICRDPSGVPAIQKYKPNIYVKGADYRDSNDLILLLEKKEVLAHDGTTIFIDPQIKFSSTKIKNVNKPFLDISDKGYNINLITEFIEKAKKVRVGIIGETITDSFQEVELDGQSPKSYCPSFAIKEKVVSQKGGAGIIEFHLRNFCESTRIVTNEGEINKLRYTDKYSKKKFFEVKSIGCEDIVTDSIGALNGTNIQLVADFGHGLLDNCTLSDGLYIMVQTNSSNFGYNIVNKWNKYRSKMVVLDRVEASLLLGRKLQKISKNIIQEIYNKLNTEVVILTTHKYGSIYYDGEIYETFPALALSTVDTIGAGDAFFSFVSLSHHLGYRADEVLLIASIAAALNTQWVCNEKSVTPKMLIELAKVVI